MSATLDSFGRPTPGKFLREAPFEEAMVKWGTPQEPLTHTVWTGDFMALCSHDIACPVCFSASAQIHRNVTPGQWGQAINPCRGCQEAGWQVRRRSWLWRLFNQPSPKSEGAQ